MHPAYEPTRNVPDVMFRVPTRGKPHTVGTVVVVAGLEKVYSPELAVPQTVPNSALLRSGSGGASKVFASHNTDLLLDISGYFAALGTNPGLTYFPVSPCRAVETRAEYRTGTELFGPPGLNARETRRFGFAGFSLGMVANSVSVPAGADGSIDEFAFDRTDVLIDVNGYFAPDDGVKGLCRAGSQGLASWHWGTTRRCRW